MKTMKTSKPKTRVTDRILERLQGFKQALENQETIAHRFTSRQITLDLKPTAYDPTMVKKTRNLLGVNQAMFAQFLGVSVRTIRSWEQGTRSPNEMACRFMDEIRRNPRYWIDRLKESAVAK